MRSYLDFEKPVAELEAKVEELRAMGESDEAVAVGEEISRLEAMGHHLKALQRDYGNMQAVYWDRREGKVLAASDPRGIGATGLR